jgi:hypothetical protein
VTPVPVLLKQSVALAWLRSLVRKCLPRRLQEARAHAAEVRQHLKYKGLPVEKVFSDIYQNKEWGGSDGGYYSGTGSHDPAVVLPYVHAVRELLLCLPAKPVVVDMGSGDFNVGSQFVDLASRYYACDIVSDLQEYNRQHYQFENVEFLCLNGVEHELPDGDIIFIRQVLQHLSNGHIQKVLEKCRKYQRWVITEHLPSGDEFVPNIDISVGCGVRSLFDSGVVLTAPPFSLTGYSSRVLCEVPEYGCMIRTTLFERMGQPEGGICAS